jgi:hypothetical protein
MPEVFGPEMICWQAWHALPPPPHNAPPAQSQVLLSTGLSLPPGQCYSRLAWGPEGLIAGACGSTLHFIEARTGEVVDRVNDAHDAEVRMWRSRGVSGAAMWVRRPHPFSLPRSRPPSHGITQLAHCSGYRLACAPQRGAYNPTLSCMHRLRAWSGPAASYAARTALRMCLRQAATTAGCGCGLRPQNWCEARGGTPPFIQVVSVLLVRDDFIIAVLFKF